MRNEKKVRNLKDENGKKIKMTIITDVEGREYTYLEELAEEDLDLVGDGGSRKFNSKRDDSNFGGW